MLYTEAQLTEIANRLIAELPYLAEPEGLYEPIRYILEAGGKRIRPVLCLAAAQAFGANIERAYPAAAAVEMYHNFTLVHDDIMDKADVRRGRPTVHKKWNQDTAILSGDTMLSLAYRLLEGLDDRHYRRVLKLFNDTAIEVFEGQQYDMDFEKRFQVFPEEYFKMIRLKTSVLLGCAVAMGAIIADAPDKSVKALYDFAINLGIAFQLRDDMLDIYSYDQEFGKPYGGDILNDKKTWFLTTALLEDKTGTVRNAVEGLYKPTQKLNEVKSVYDVLNLPCRCEAEISKYTRTAIDSLKAAELNDEAFKWFSDFADHMMKRTK